MTYLENPARGAPITCAFCGRRGDRPHSPSCPNPERERFEEMIHAAEWPDRIVPALADMEARP